MNILLLCRWKITDVLTASTVVPHLHALVKFEHIENIILVTLEKDKTIDFGILGWHAVLEHQKVHWRPMVSFSGPNRYINQIADTLLHSTHLVNVVKENNVQSIISHGAPAGALAYKVWERSLVPFYVSSFEPHADYMLDSGVWKKLGLKYMFQKYWEQLQKKNATGLMPVAHNFKVKLVQEEVSAEKAFVVPCSVEPDTFSFEKRSRDDLRLQLGWRLATVGIYVGKYGDLYYKEEAFVIYKKCFELIPDFRLIILSPQSKESIQELLQQHQIKIANVYVSSVPHGDVPQYLSAADFAFATIKSYPSAKYCSPVKIGEYWANGLPVLLTEGVGDDSDIIKNEGGGATFNLQEEGSVEGALQQILQILQDPNHRQEIPKLAQKYRSPERIREAYEYFFGQKQEDQK